MASSSEPARFIDAAEVGRILAVSRQRVAELLGSHQFPIPLVGPNGYRLFLWEVVLRWGCAYPDRRIRGERPELPVLGQLASEAERILDLARGEAEELNHPWVGVNHILIAMLNPECPGAARDVLQSLGLTADRLRQSVVERLGDPFEPQERVPEVRGGTELVLALANCEASELQDEVVASEHVLLAISNASNGQIPRELEPDAVRDRVLAVTEGSVPVSELPPARKPIRNRPSSPTLPEVAPSPAGHDPRRRKPWASVGLLDASGQTIEWGDTFVQYRVDRDGYPVLTPDGQPVHIERDESGEPVRGEDGELVLAAFNVPPGAEVKRTMGWEDW